MPETPSMPRSAKYESLGGCIRPWRDGRLRGLLARIQRLRGPRASVSIVLSFPKTKASPSEFSELPRPWLDDRLKNLVAHIERLRRMELIGRR